MSESLSRLYVNANQPKPPEEDTINCVLIFLPENKGFASLQKIKKLLYVAILWHFYFLLIFRYSIKCITYIRYFIKINIYSEPL